MAAAITTIALHQRPGVQEQGLKRRPGLNDSTVQVQTVIVAARALLAA